MTAATVPGAALSGATSLAQIARNSGALLAVSLLFSGFSTWAFTNGVLPLPPLAVMLLVLALAGSALILDPSRRGPARIKVWSVASACLAMLAFLWSSGSEIALQETQTRVLSAVLLVGFSVLMADGATRTVARRAIAVSTLVTVAIHVWEITHPLQFSAVLGRSAAFYINPNIAGAALVTGMLLALPVIPARLRELFALVVGAGVFLTLSRGALLCFGLAVAILLASRQLRAQRIAWLTCGGVLLVASAIGSAIASGELSYLNGGAERFVAQRLGIGSREELSADASATSRSLLLGRAIDLFAERPLTGFGTGATVEWSEAESTHNIYVRHVAEYGVLGATLMPMLLFITWPARSGRSRSMYQSTARAFVVFLAVWGGFSHNVADDPFVLLGLALITSQTNRFDMEPEAGPTR